MRAIVTALVVAVFLALPLAAAAADPTLGLFRDKEDERNMDCRRLSQEEAHRLYPDRVPEPAVRTIGGATVDLLLCKRRYIRLGERPARDELILTKLRESTSDIARAAAAHGAGLTWHVDAFYPQMEVAAKIAVAARTELVEKGERVSDRVPLLAAGDIVVLWRLPPEQQYAIACKRWFAEGSLTDRDAFLGMMIVDPRETQLHAGVCVAGKWTWIR